jgi:hypothetical protein
MGATVTLEMTGAGVRPARMYADRDIKIVIGRITLDSSYPSGGEEISLANDLNLSELYTIVFTPATSGTGATKAAVAYTYDYTNNKVLAINTSAGIEYVNGTNTMGSFTTRFVAFGI